MNWTDKSNVCLLGNSLKLTLLPAGHCSNCIEDRYGFFEQFLCLEQLEDSKVLKKIFCQIMSSK